MRKADYNQPVA